MVLSISYPKIDSNDAQLIEKIIVSLLNPHPSFKPSIRTIKQICDLSTPIFASMPNILNLHSPITVCGDIHGQHLDLISLFSVCGHPPFVQFLFLGDYVDRGYASLECLILLLCLKLKFPSKIHILRGNHESRLITQCYGFYDECKKKTGSAEAWTLFTKLFDLLPLCAVIDGKTFSLHGGLGPTIENLELIERLNRNKEVPSEGTMCDLLWSDPLVSTFGYNEEGTSNLKLGLKEENINSKEIDEFDHEYEDERLGDLEKIEETNILGNTTSSILESGFSPSPRGAGVMFGPDVTDRFLRRNGLDGIVRAHQVVQEGWLWAHNNKVLTVFSAPNYCYRCGNKGGVVEINERGKKNTLSFEEEKREGFEEINMKDYELPDYFI